jgi:polysaccharide pyruvyl transferase WcaK-like protein
MDRQMTSQAKGTGPRVGLFGLLGSGNIGNDASVEVIVRYLRADHPDAVLDAMCMGVDRMRDRYGIETKPIQWQSARELPGGPLGAGLKVLGKVLEIYRTATWVRRHDVVIIPGMGIMDATLPINPWGMPWSLFLLSATGRLLGTKVALVSAGVTPAKNPATARLNTWAARYAYYRSFRDEASRDVLRRGGLDTSGDPVYPDLVFSLKDDPDDALPAVDPLAVGVGVMSYHGGNEDRDRAEEIYAAYVSKMQSFVRWLIDSGRSVRLFVGDELDQPVVDAIVADIRRSRPDIDPARITGTPVTTFPELVSLVASVTTVVASRFHNLLLALKLGKPTISVSYSPKCDSLMADFGLAEYAQHIRRLDAEKLKDQFTQIEGDAPQVRERIRELLPKRAAQSRAQLDELNRVLFGGGPAAKRQSAARQRVRRRFRRLSRLPAKLRKVPAGVPSPPGLTQ